MYEASDAGFIRHGNRCPKLRLRRLCAIDMDHGRLGPHLPSKPTRRGGLPGVRVGGAFSREGGAL